MKLSTSLLTFCALFFTFSLAAQEVNERVSSPRAYAAGSKVRPAAAAALDATFQEQKTGLLHMYVDPKVASNKNYMFVGNEIGGDMLLLFSGKYFRYGKREDTKVYAAAAVKGADENLYVVRYQTSNSQRLELFDLVNGRMKHVKTLATRRCNMNGCRQLDSYLVDVDMDGRTDLIQMSRFIDSKLASSKERQYVYKMMPNGQFKRQKMDIPANTKNALDFFNSIER